MERRKQAIEKHLKALNIPRNMLEEATKIGLKCSKSITTKLKECAGIGLYMSASKRGSPYSYAELAEMLNIKRNKLFKGVCEFKKTEPPPVTPRARERNLEKLLSTYSVPNEVKLEAFGIVEELSELTPNKAACVALASALQAKGHFPDFQHLQRFSKLSSKNLEKYVGKVLDKKEPALRSKKTPKLASAQSRLLALLNKQPPEGGVLSLSVLEAEKNFLDQSLGINLNAFCM